MRTSYFGQSRKFLLTQAQGRRDGTNRDQPAVDARVAGGPRASRSPTSRPQLFIDSCVAAELPIVFGEIANKQDEQVDGQTAFGFYDLDGSKVGPGETNGFTYQSLLSVLQQQQIGWLAWSWGPDQCDARRISSDGTFDSLTEYGMTLFPTPNTVLWPPRRAQLIN